MIDTYLSKLCSLSNGWRSAPAGGGDGHAGLVYPGYHWWRKHRRSQRCGAAGYWSDHHGHWCVHGTELWLPPEPCQRPGTPTLHGCSRMGDGGLQVTAEEHRSGFCFFLKEPYVKFIAWFLTASNQTQACVGLVAMQHVRYHLKPGQIY